MLRRLVLISSHHYHSFFIYFFNFPSSFRLSILIFYSPFLIFPYPPPFTAPVTTVFIYMPVLICMPLFYTSLLCTNFFSTIFCFIHVFYYFLFRRTPSLTITLLPPIVPYPSYSNHLRFLQYSFLYPMLCLLLFPFLIA